MLKKNKHEPVSEDSEDQLQISRCLFNKVHFGSLNPELKWTLECRHVNVLTIKKKIAIDFICNHVHQFLFALGSLTMTDKGPRF